jgi:serine/threonine-protein kinase
MMEQEALAPTLPEQGLDGKGGQGRSSSEFGDRAKTLIKSLVGRVLKGQYRMDAVLGQGAMGLVFRGTQTALSKAVAIKMMRPDAFHTNESRDRFAREATVVSKLLHPSITQVLDFGIEDDMPFLVMEFVDGKELTDVLAAEGPMPPTRALAIIRQLASALEEAHRQGVVHRDIKPQNLRLMRYTPGGQVFLKVLDFGIAKQMDDGGEKGKLTATGAVMGTPMYMAPEQAGGHKVDARADQYSLGIVLYELLTGTVPFTGETLAGVLVSHLTQPPPPLPRQVPEPLQKVVMRLLAKNPNERFADMAELDKALAACEPACRDVAALPAGRVHAFVAGGALPDSPAPSSNRPLVLGGAVAGAAVLLLIGAAVFGPRLRAHRNPPPVTTPSVDKLATPMVAEAPVANPPPARPTAELPSAPVPPAPTPKPPEVAEPTGKPAPHSGRSPAKSTSASESGGHYDAESQAAKEKLDQAKSLLDSGDGSGAMEWALRTQSDGRYARAYRILTMASCQSANIGKAKTFFHNVAPADRKAVIKYCREHDKDLTE